MAVSAKNRRYPTSDLGGGHHRGGQSRSDGVLGIALAGFSKVHNLALTVVRRHPLKSSTNEVSHWKAVRGLNSGLVTAMRR